MANSAPPLAKQASMKQNFLEDLEKMEKVVEIYEVLGGQAEPRLNNLVTPYRRLVTSFDCLVNDLSSSKTKVPQRVFVFEDQIILAKFKDPSVSSIGLGKKREFVNPRAKKDEIQMQKKKSVGIMKRFSFNRKSTSASMNGGSSASSSAATETGGAAGNNGGDNWFDIKLSLSHYLPLDSCTVKHVKVPPEDLEGAFGFSLNHVTRDIQSVPSSASDKSAPPVKTVVTKVGRLDLWFNDESKMHEIFYRIQGLIEEIKEQEEEASFQSQTRAGSKARSWVKSKSAKNVLMAGSSGRSAAPTSSSTTPPNGPFHARQESVETVGTDFDFINLTGPGSSGVGAASLSPTNHNNGELSLKDIEERYNVDFSAKPAPTKIAHVRVEFGEGQMGFALTSASGVGVIVSKLAPGSFAEMGGVTIGDRVSAVNGVEVDVDMSWTKAVEMIKVAGRPITIDFVRNVDLSERVEAVEEAEANHNSSPQRQQQQQAPPPPSGVSTTSSPATARNGMENSDQQATTAGGGANPTASSQPEQQQSTPQSGKRRWHAKRNPQASAGLLSLRELERMYEQTKGDELIGVRRTDTGMTGEDEDAPPPEESSSSAPPPIGAGGGSGTLPLHQTSRGKLYADSSHVRARKLLDELAAEAPREEERGCFLALKEILETEAAYLTDLRALINDYVLPLRRAMRRRKCRDKEDGTLVCEHRTPRALCNLESSESAPLVSPEDVRAIFGNVETLIKINHELLNAFSTGMLEVVPEAREYDPTAGGINAYLMSAVGVFSTAIEKITPFFSMYALYCHQYATAIERLRTLRSSDEDVDKMLRDREAKSAQTSLRSLLIKPVQRICRYPLLFQDLVKRITVVGTKIHEAEARAKGLDGGRGGLEGVGPVPPSPNTMTQRRAKFDTFVSELERTTAVVERIANDVNKKVEEKDNSGLMMMVYHELGGGTDGAGSPPGDSRVANKLLEPQRKFVLSDGNVYFREAHGSEPQQGKLFLFSDLVILALPHLENLRRDRAKSSNFGEDGSKRTGRSRSFSRLIGRKATLGSMDGNAAGGGGGGAGGGGLGDATTIMVPWTMRATHWIDLKTASIKPMAEADDVGRYGFQLKSVERIVVNADGTPVVIPTGDEGESSSFNALREKKKSWRSRNGTLGKSGAGAAASGARVVTTVVKFEVWMDEREALDRLLNAVEENIEKLRFLKEISAVEGKKFGGAGTNRTRSWTMKKKKSMGSSMDAGEGDYGALDDEEGGRETSSSRRTRGESGGPNAKAALEALSKKYQGQAREQQQQQQQHQQQ